MLHSFRHDIVVSAGARADTFVTFVLISYFVVSRPFLCAHQENPSARFLGTSFLALVHLVFKSLKHLASVDTE